MEVKEEVIGSIEDYEKKMNEIWEYDNEEERMDEKD